MNYEKIDGVDYLELMALKLKKIDTEGVKPNHPAPNYPVPDYIEPKVIYHGSVVTVKDLALRHYAPRISNPVGRFSRALDLKDFGHFQADDTAHGLLTICFLAPMKKRFSQLYLVMSKQQAIGIYMNDELIGTVDKSNPVVTREIMKPHLPGLSKRTLDSFCEGLSDAARSLVIS